MDDITKTEECLGLYVTASRPGKKEFGEWKKGDKGYICPGKMRNASSLYYLSEGRGNRGFSEALLIVPAKNFSLWKEAVSESVGFTDKLGDGDRLEIFLSTSGRMPMYAIVTFIERLAERVEEEAGRIRKSEGNAFVRTRRMLRKIFNRRQRDYVMLEK